MRPILLTLFVSLLMAGQCRAQCASIIDSIRFYHEQADHFRNTNPDRAYLNLDRAVDLSRRRGCWSDMIKSLLKKSNCAGFNLQMGLVSENLKEAEKALHQHRSELTEQTDSLNRQIHILWASYYYDIGHFNLSMDHWRQVLKDLENKSSLTPDELLDLLSAHLFIAEIHKARGSFEAALANYYRSTHYAGIRSRKMGREPNYNYVYTYLARLFREKGAPDSARYYYRKRLARLEESYKRDSLQRLRGTLISLCNDLASFYREQHDLDSSFLFLGKAEGYLADNDPFRARIYFEYGLTYTETGKYNKAADYFKQNLVLVSAANRKEKSTEQAQTYTALGDLLIRQKRWKEGLRYYQSALIQLAREFNEQDLLLNPKLEHILSNKELLDVLDKKSEALYQWHLSASIQPKAFRAAWETTLLAIDLIDSIKVEYTSDIDKYFLLESSYPIFSRAIELALKQGRKMHEKAFELAEKSKAVVLFEALRNTQAEAFAGIPPSELEQMQQIRASLTGIEQAIVQTDDPGKLSRLRNEHYRLKNEYQQRIKAFEEAYPDYYRLKYDLNPLPVAKIRQELLASNQALITYFTAAEQAFAFMIDPNLDRIIIERLDWNDNIAGWAQTLKKEILANNDEGYIRKARGLYQTLLGPLISQTRADHLIIIPDGVLGYVPFDALLTEEVAGENSSDYRKWPYLLRKKRISQCFSASMLWAMSRSEKIAAGIGVLAYAPSYRETTEDVPLTVNPRAERGQLSPLAFNDEEAEGIKSLSCGTVVCDEKASKAHFLRNAPDGRIVHIAAHARIYQRQPHQSYIAFTNKGDTLKEPYKLFIYEIYQHAIPAELIVLSACETGAGKVLPGEGIISIARAFSYGGTRSLVTTLWSIDDFTSKDLMLNFYKNLKKDYPKDEALQQAKLTYLQQAPDRARAHPKYWAAYVPVGNMAPVKIRSCSLVSSLLLGLALLSGALGLIWWLKPWNWKFKRLVNNPG